MNREVSDAISLLAKHKAALVEPIDRHEYIILYDTFCDEIAAYLGYQRDYDNPDQFFHPALH